MLSSSFNGRERKLLIICLIHMKCLSNNYKSDHVGFFRSSSLLPILLAGNPSNISLSPNKKMLINLTVLKKLSSLIKGREPKLTSI